MDASKPVDTLVLQILEEEIELVLADEEINSALLDTELFAKDLERCLHEARETLCQAVARDHWIWQERSDELKVQRRWAKEIRDVNRGFWKAVLRLLMFLSVTAFLCFVGVVGLSGSRWLGWEFWEWLRPVQSRPLWPYMIGAATTCGFALFLAKLVRRKIVIREEFILQAAKVDVLEQEVESARKQVKKRLSKIVLLQAREIISANQVTSYELQFSIRSNRGLSDVYDSEYEVGTTSHRELERVIESMNGEIGATSGGTIGVSGPRGAGKTTLLHSLCQSKKGDGGKHHVGFSVAAPVRYDAREFVLYVFSKACQEVLTLVGVPFSRLRKTVREQTDVSAIARRLESSPLSMFLLLFAVAGFILGIVGAAEEMGARTRSPTEGVGTADEVPGPGKTEDVKEPGSQTLGDDGDDSSLFIAVVREYRSEMFGMGVAGLVLLLASLYIHPLHRFARRPPRSWTSILEEAKQRSASNEGSKEVLEWWTRAERAVEHLESIHFQQSFSSGWKGSLSLPHVGADISATETLARRQQTLPDIVDSFKEFVKGLPTDYPVLIGIDEIDKMVPADAALFLNDIKSLFGTPNCLYLVTVSESASSDFERRGLPRRDVYDSCFHEIVSVRYMSLAESKRMLSRRVVGMSVPFHALCHCFAGGLPRDLIRFGRKLDTLCETSRNELPDLARALVQEEVNAKIDALKLSLKTISLEKELLVLLGTLSQLRAAEAEPSPLLIFASELWQRPEVRTQGNKAEVEESRVLAGFAREIGCFTYFAATILETIDEFVAAEKSVTGPAKETYRDKTFGLGGCLDGLARARQLMMDNPMISVTEVSRLRTGWGLGVPQGMPGNGLGRTSAH